MNMTRAMKNRYFLFPVAAVVLAAIGYFCGVSERRCSLLPVRAKPANLLIVHFGTQTIYSGAFASEFRLTKKNPRTACKPSGGDNVKGLRYATNYTPA